VTRKNGEYHSTSYFGRKREREARGKGCKGSEKEQSSIHAESTEKTREEPIKAKTQKKKRDPCRDRKAIKTDTTGTGKYGQWEGKERDKKGSVTNLGGLYEKKINFNAKNREG